MVSGVCAFVFFLFSFFLFVCVVCADCFVVFEYVCVFVWDELCDDVWFVVGAVLMCRLICSCVASVKYCVMLYGGLFFFV